jgi:SAM-dependent methyltransferase
MQTTERLVSEQHFHDRQAERRLADLNHPNLLRFADEDWLDHETWIRPAIARLGPVAGLPILDLGCGHGMASVVLARRGARVTAVDLSAGYVREAQLRADANGVELCCVQAEGERLPFADGSFARIWGNAILHHLDLERAGPELRRVLQPGGMAVFCEPWAGNPLLNLARGYLPYPGKERTVDERPLGLQRLRQQFAHVEVQGFQLLAMLRRVLPWRGLDQRLEAWDRRLLTAMPALKKWCRYVVVTLAPTAVS